MKIAMSVLLCILLLAGIVGLASAADSVEMTTNLLVLVVLLFMILVVFICFCFLHQRFSPRVKQEKAAKEQRKQAIQKAVESPVYAEARTEALMPLDCVVTYINQRYHSEDFIVTGRYVKGDPDDKFYLYGKIPDYNQEVWLEENLNKVVRFWVRGDIFSSFEPVPVEERK